MRSVPSNRSRQYPASSCHSTTVPTAPKRSRTSLPTIRHPQKSNSTLQLPKALSGTRTRKRRLSASASHSRRLAGRGIRDLFRDGVGVCGLGSAQALPARGTQRAVVGAEQAGTCVADHSSPPDSPDSPALLTQPRQAHCRGLGPRNAADRPVRTNHARRDRTQAFAGTHIRAHGHTRHARLHAGARRHACTRPRTRDPPAPASMPAPGAHRRATRPPWQARPWATPWSR